MNCSNYPMDVSAYSERGHEAFLDYLLALDAIRRNPRPRCRRDPEHQVAEHHLIASLERRMARLPEGTIVVPCGAVATAILSKCRTEHLDRYPERVPHPARNRWRAARNFGDLDSFLEVLRSAATFLDFRAANSGNQRSLQRCLASDGNDARGKGR